MYIGEFVKCLEALPKELMISNVNPNDYGSDRGDYYQFYIGENSNEVWTVGYILDLIKNRVIGKTFTGYKGGDFTMDEDCEIRLGAYGCGGSEIDGILIDYDYNHGVMARIKTVQVLRY